MYLGDLMEKAECGQFFLLNFIYCVNNFVSLLGFSSESHLVFYFRKLDNRSL